MKSFTLDYVKDVFAKEGYILCDLEYKNNSKPLQYKCPKGHFGKISLTSWKSGGRCAKCAKNAKMTIEEIREAFVEEGYVLISKEYKNAHSPLEYICPNGHRHYITWSNWNNKKKFRCPKCSNRISKQEFELHTLLNFWGISFESNCRNIITNPYTNKGLELDIWIPSFNKAIEFNGEYWHSKEDRYNLDNLKLRLCANSSIELLIIWYKDWITNQNQEVDRLMNFLF